MHVELFTISVEACAGRFTPPLQIFSWCRRRADDLSARRRWPLTCCFFIVEIVAALTDLPADCEAVKSMKVSMSSSSQMT